MTRAYMCHGKNVKGMIELKKTFRAILDIHQTLWVFGHFFLFFLNVFFNVFVY